VSITAVPLAVEGCAELRLEPSTDRRGSFLKLFQTSAFRAAGIDLDVREIFISRSHTGVVRGLHFQRPPADVAKVVWCLEGTVIDAVVDLRSSSPTFRQHCLVELSAELANAVHVPRGCAHGFLVTGGEALVAYAQSGEHDPVREGGVLWSSAGIDWPVPAGRLAELTISDRDAAFPTLDQLDGPFP